MSCWTLRSKVFGAMTKEHLVSEGVLPVSTMEVPTSGLTGWHIPENLSKTPYGSCISFWTGQTGGRHPSWQRWRPLGWVVGCGRLCVGGLWKPYLHTWKRPWSGCKRWSWQRRVLSDELSRGCHGKMEYFTVRGRGKRLAQLQNLLMLSWKSGLFTLTHATTSKVLCLDRANKIEQLSFAEVDRKTMAHQRRSSRCGPLERKAKLEWHHTCHHDAKLGFEIQLFVASLVYLSPST